MPSGEPAGQTAGGKNMSAEGSGGESSGSIVMDGTQFAPVEGPTAWCDDPAISTDLNYRWDGVHVYKPGANLIYETIAPALLQIQI